MKLKKWLAMLMTGCMMAGSLAGCGNAADGEKADTSESAD